MFLKKACTSAYRQVSSPGDVTVYTHILCTCARRNFSAYQNSKVLERKLVLLHMVEFPLSDVTVYTLYLCTCARRNLSAYQNSMSWEGKLVLLHMDGFVSAM